MRGIVLLLTLLAALTGCTQLIGLEDVSVKHYIGGRVHGLWDGAGGVTLQLEAKGLSVPLTVSANGDFHFNDALVSGTSYSVAVTSSPAQHTCVVDGGGNGTVADTDVITISIACAGPAMEIDLSGPWGWRFDPTEEVQTFAGSIVAQEVALTIRGTSLTGVSIDRAMANLGEQTTPIALPLGSRMVPVAVTANGGLSKTYELVFNRAVSIIDQIAYGKASNTDAYDEFGWAVSLSGDTLAVGAPGEDSPARGVNGNQAVNFLYSSGAVYVFVRTGTTWTQQAYLKASNTDEGNVFGHAVSLSGDTLAVGAPGEESSATGVNGEQNNDSAINSGAVYVFVRTGTTWAQQAYLKASNTGADDEFGSSVSLSGNTLAVGAPREDSGVSSNPTDNSAGGSGEVYVFVYTGTWREEVSLKASNIGAGDGFGSSVSLSGNTLAVGAPGEESAATGINGNQADNSASGAGAVYVFVRTNGWHQQAYLKASNTEAGDGFGASVSLSGDTLAVGAPGEASAATGVNGDQADNSARGAGAVYLFARTDMTWTQQAYLKASNTGEDDQFGSLVSLSGDTLAVGAPGEASAATGVGGNQADSSASGAGAVYLFVRAGTMWTQQAYLKASNTGAGDGFGSSISLSGDTVVVGAPPESSGTTGINGNQTDNAATDAGAVYVFR